MSDQVKQLEQQVTNLTVANAQLNAQLTAHREMISEMFDSTLKSKTVVNLLRNENAGLQNQKTQLEQKLAKVCMELNEAKLALSANCTNADETAPIAPEDQQAA
jgi:hypothetical protein